MAIRSGTMKFKYIKSSLIAKLKIPKILFVFLLFTIISYSLYFVKPVMKRVPTS